MKVITEATLRSLFRKAPFDTFQVEKGQILTPSAAGFLAERKIQILEAGADPAPASKPQTPDGNEAPPAEEAKPAEKRYPYVSALDGSRYEAKPEHMTHLAGNRLIPKDHPRIVFRGKLDSLQSAILLVQAHAIEKGLPGLSADLGQILDWTREIMKADVLDTDLEMECTLGLSTDELRQHSHYPKKHYGVGHIMPAVDMGYTLLALNDLRSRVREVETCAVNAFRCEFKTRRQDLLQALNRMSSAVYILMVREQAGVYSPGQPGVTDKQYG
ncbi:MAG: ATP-binding protein [Desulfobacter sp.]|nr:MAG: ATP-binding protein [Desulfobacter sp.]